MEKTLSKDEVVRRIMSLEAEEKNAGICDYIVSGEDAQKAAQELITDLLKKGKKR